MLQNLFYDYIVLERGFSKNTLLSYRSDIDHYFNHFNRFDVPSEDVKEYLSNLKCSASTRARKISALKSMYNFFVSNGYMSSSPFETIKGIKRAKNIPSYLTIDEIKRIASTFQGDYLGVRDKLIFDLLIYTGARISEIIDLSVSDIDYNKKFLKVLGKGSKTRFIPMNEVLIEGSERYIKDFRPLFMEGIKSDPLFPKITRNSYWARLQSYAKKAGVTKRVYPHILRHSFATIMLNNGANIRHVQEFLGHSNAATTEIYTHVSVEKLKTAYNSIDLRRE